MAMKARYTVMDGEIVSQTRNGVRHHYVPDPLGSVVALYDTNQTKTDTFSYWPYGEEKSRTGATNTPFRFVGGKGYYSDTSSRAYVRARYLLKDRGLWLTTDVLHFVEAAQYKYANASPTTWIDIFGLREQQPGGGGVGPGACPGKGAFDDIVKIIRSSPACLKAVNKACGKGGGFSAVVKRIKFITDEDCDDDPNTKGSTCTWTVPDPGPGPCKSGEICFDKGVCETESRKRLACLLLFEVANWCACEYLNRYQNEKTAIAIISACGLNKTCGPGGTVG